MDDDDLGGLGWDWDLDRDLEHLARRMAEKRRAREELAREAHRRGEVMHVMLPSPGRQPGVWTLAVTLSM